MAADTESLVLSISADTAQIKRQLKALVGDAQQAGRGIEDAFGKIGNDNRPAANLSRSFEQAQNDAKNLGFQINDLATSIAGGGGVMRALAQQGGQISQIFSGGNMKTIGATITAALVDPFVLLPVAISLATVAMSQFFGETTDDAKEMDKQLRENLDLINKVREGQGLKALDRSRDKVEQIINVEAEKARIDQIADYLSAQLTRAQNQISDTSFRRQAAVGQGGVEALRDLDAAISDLQAGIARGDADWFAFLKSLNTLKDKELPANVKGLVVQLLKMAEAGARNARDLKDMKDTLDNTAKAAERAAEGSKKFTDKLKEMGDIAKAQVTDVEKLLQLYQDAVKSAQTMGDVQLANQTFQTGVERITNAATDKELRDYARSRLSGMIKQESRGDPNAKNPNSTATGLGQFIDSTWLRLFPKVFPGLAAGASREQQLGFRDNADISRRMMEELAVENLKAMRAAGTIIVDGAVYLAHFLGAEGAQKVLKAAPGTPISQLVSPAALAANREVFAKHQTAGEVVQWAAAIESGTKAVKEQKTAFDDLFAANERRLAQAERESGINRDSSLSSDQKKLALNAEAAAAEEATIKEQLLNAAKSQGLEITPALTKKITEQAHAMAQAGLEAENLAVRQSAAQKAAADAEKAAAKAEKDVAKRTQESRQVWEQVAGIAQGAITGIVQDLRNGVDAADAFYNAISRIADQLLSMALNMAIKAMLNSLFPAPVSFVGGAGGLFASGGYTGNHPTDQAAGIVHGREFVINAAATRRHRGLLEAINAGVPGYASGGFVLPNLGAAIRSSPPPQQTSPRVDARVSVVNTFDAGSFLSEALSRPDGVNVILNAVRAQPGAFRQAMQS